MVRWIAQPARKIPVVVFDSGRDSTNYVSFVATTISPQAKLVRAQLAALLNRQGNHRDDSDAPGSASTMDRERGFKEAMAQEFFRYGDCGRAIQHVDPCHRRCRRLKEY